MTDEIIKLLDELAKRFGVVIDWTSENVMPYLTEVYDRFITYSIVKCSIIPVLFIVFLIITIWVSLKMSKYLSDETYCWITTILWIGTLIFFVLGFFNIYDLLQLTFVPEIYSIQWINNYLV